MNNQKKLLLGVLLLPFWLGAQVSWQKTFPNQGITGVGRDVQPLEDGSFILLGEVDYPTGALRHYIKMAKISQEGGLLWEKIYKQGEITLEAGYSVREKSDGGFLIGGYRGIPNTRIYAINTDQEGDTLYTKTIASTINETGNVIRALPNGEIILAGTGFGGAFKIPIVMKLDADGNVIWRKNYPSPASGGDGVADLEPTDDGNFIFVFNNGMGISFLKIDPSGEILRSGNKMVSLLDIPVSICNANDGGILVAGIANNATGSAPFILKFDANGQHLWTEILPYPSHSVYSIKPDLVGGGYVLGMAGKPSGTTQGKVYFLKMDESGMIEWERAYPGEYNRFAAYPVPDGGYVGVGTRGNAMMLIKADETGNAVGADDISEQSDFLEVIPNPVSADFAMCRLGQQFVNGALLVGLFDTMGKEVYAERVNMVDGAVEFMLPLAGCTEGLYFLRAGGQVTKVVVKK